VRLLFIAQAIAAVCVVSALDLKSAISSKQAKKIIPR
jgi:hypothetical protein